MIFNLIILFFVSFYGALAMDTAWWRNTIIYEVFIWSFKDSNGDGIGDIKGVTMMLDHFVDLKIPTLYLSPFFTSPMQDQGFDVANYTEIDPMFGTMEDFEELVREMNKRGMKLLTDLVINHSSDKCDWFQKSIDRIPPYDEFYVWKDAKGQDINGKPMPPNNWLSLFSGSAWEWNDKRKQFYFHQFSKNQPDFNLRDRILKRTLLNVLKFWLDKGVAGMRLDAVIQFMEDKAFRDEPFVDKNKTSSDCWLDLEHIYTSDLWETYEFVHELREYLDKYNKKKDDFERIFASEAYTTRNYTMLYYGTKDFPVVHFPFNFDFLEKYEKFENALLFDKTMHGWLDNMPQGGVANWNVENHDNPRVGTRINPQFSDIMIITMMMAPGVAYVYYGQEIGMANHNIRNDQMQDQNIDSFTLGSRDGERTPMQWDDSINAGFSGKLKPWLPVNPNYSSVNVKRQKKQKNSFYNLFKTLSTLRHTYTLKYGNFKSYVLSTWVFAFTRHLENHETYVIVHNLGSETEIVDLHLNIRGLPPMLEVVASSLNSGFRKGHKIMSRPKFPKTLIMRPTSSVVLKTGTLIT